MANGIYNCSMQLSLGLLIILMGLLAATCSGDDQPCYGGVDFWKCSTTETCIWSSQRCDGTPDCRDGSDERNCVYCQDSMSTLCEDGTCVPYLHSCNGCIEGQWKCLSSDTCIWDAQRCDGQFDCADKSDESGCRSCGINSIMCNGMCSQPLYDCNGCIQGQWKCSTSADCVGGDGRCNGRVECNDGSDELNCVACKDNAFLCNNKKCVPRSFQCNQWDDCGDNSDEAQCACGYFQWKCKSSGECISSDFRCNNVVDCTDGSDEANCPKKTCDGVLEWACKDSSTCIPYNERCNARLDCSDGSDEQNCDSCLNGNFLCKNGTCILHDLVCDGKNDCGDNSDEASCSTHPQSNNLSAKLFGGLFGGIAGFLLLVAAIISITVTVCVRNKKCPLYKRREPPVVLVDGIEPNEENIEDNVSLLHTDRSDVCLTKDDNGVNTGEINWYSNVFLEY